MPKTFVLVHGAWHGGWCWRRVADLLEQQGHKVFTPTLTGLGERRISGAGINLTHPHHRRGQPDQMGAALRRRAVRPFLRRHGDRRRRRADRGHDRLDRVPRRLRAGERRRRWRLTAGECTRDASRPRGESGDIGVPPRSAEAFGVNEKDRAWVDAHVHAAADRAPSPRRSRLTGAREKIAQEDLYPRAELSESRLRQGAGAGQGRPVVAHLRGAVRPRRHGG